MPSRSADFRLLIERLDALVDGFEAHPDPAVGAAAADLVGMLRALHTTALARLLRLLGEDRERYDRALADPLVANVLLLHDLISVDERRLAEQVLASFAPRGQAARGDVRLLGVQDGVVRVRLSGTAAGLRTPIEEALADGLPGFQRLEIEGGNGCAASAAEPWPEILAVHGDGTTSCLPVEKAQELEKRLQEAQAREQRHARRQDRRPMRRVALGRLGDIAPQTLHPDLVDGYPVLVVRCGAEVRAFRNACPGSMLPLHAGSLQDGVIACPWHGCRFDAATGTRVGGEVGAALERLRVTVEDGIVRIDLP